MISFRPTTQEDASLIAEWIEADADHKGWVVTEFFTTPDDRSTVYTIEDSKGPVIFVRQEVEGMNVRLHTEFLPDGKLRIARALHQAFPAVYNDAKQRGFKQVIFDSKSMSLIAFMIKHFGFYAECKVQL